MAEIKITEGMIRGLKREFDKLVLEEFQAHEKANKLSRERGVQEHILEQALEELMYDVAKNPKYGCPKCGGRVQACEAWRDPSNGFPKSFSVGCFTCSGASTGLPPRSSRVEALLDWFNQCNKEDNNEKRENAS